MLRLARNVWRSHSATRNGFTLIELLVTITIIGILASMALAGMSIANSHAKVIKTKSTITKLHNQMMQRWESYRNRRLPVEPRSILMSTGTPQYTYATGVMTTLAANLNAASPGKGNSLLVPSTSPLYPTPAQVAVVRLLAVRELQQFEMPTGWGDLVDFKATPAPTPGQWTLRPTNILPTWPQLAQRYLAKLNAAGTALMAQSGATSASVTQQLDTYDSAEALYMILSNNTDESWSAADQVKDIGDTDGDGLPEFQDAWIESLRSYTPKGAANKPIQWIRWPAGFYNNIGGNNWLLSDYQGDVFQPDPMTFSLDYHDYFDPLKLDLPTGTTGGGTPQPRGYQLTPLIYSAGQDNEYGITPSAWNDNAYTQQQQQALVGDPYAYSTQSSPSNMAARRRPTCPSLLAGQHHQPLDDRPLNNASPSRQNIGEAAVAARRHADRVVGGHHDHAHDFGRDDPDHSAGAEQSRNARGGPDGRRFPQRCEKSRGFDRAPGRSGI